MQYIFHNVDDGMGMQMFVFSKDNGNTEPEKCCSFAYSFSRMRYKKISIE